MSCRNLDASSLTVGKASCLPIYEWLMPSKYPTIGDVKARLIELYGKFGQGFGNCVRVYKSFFDNFNDNSASYIAGQSFMLTRIDGYENSDYCIWLCVGVAGLPIYLMRRFNGNWWGLEEIAYKSQIPNTTMAQNNVIKQQMGGYNSFSHRRLRYNRTEERREAA